MKSINWIKKLPLRVLVWFYAIACFYPLLYMLFYSLKNNTEIFYKNPFGIPTTFRIENYVLALTSFNVLLYFRNSIVVSAFSLILVISVSLLFAYSVARIDWKFSKLVNTYLMTGLFIPMLVIMIPLAILERKTHLSGTYLALILPYGTTGLSFTSMVFYSFFRTLPQEIEESAYIDGAGILRAFVQIIVPMVKSAIATVTILNFLTFWNEYPMAMILLNSPKLKTLPTGLMNFAGQFVTDWGAMGAAMVIASIPTVVMYLVMSKHVEKALTVGSAVKG